MTCLRSRPWALAAGLFLAGGVALAASAGEQEFGVPSQPAAAASSQAATVATTSVPSSPSRTSANAGSITTVEVELLHKTMLEGTPEEQAQLDEKLREEGRGELREYLEVQVLLSRGQLAKQEPSLQPLLEQQSEFMRDRLLQRPLTVEQLDQRLERLGQLKGSSSEFRRRHDRLLDSLTQLRVRLTNRHGDERRR